MTTTTTITNICQIAEDYGREIGLAEFQVERIVHAKKDDKTNASSTFGSVS